MASFHGRRRSDDSDGVSPAELSALVVDDDPDYRAYVARLVGRAGFDVEQAVDGEAARLMLECRTYDLALIDHEMPRLKGLELITSIRADESSAGMFAVMLTGTGTLEIKLAALSAGFDDFLRKSECDAEIMAKIVAARRVILRQRSLDLAARELYGLATRDELTGVFNRRHFVAEAERLLATAASLTLVLFDLDDFKRVNDTWGHLCGDSVLRDIGCLFHSMTRPDDLVARFGGDEFVLMIADQDRTVVRGIAQRLVNGIRAMQWPAGGEQFSVGATTGVSSSTAPHAGLAPLLEEADRDLYRNKRRPNRSESRPSSGEQAAGPRA